jgi:hypothetical protein
LLQSPSLATKIKLQREHGHENQGNGFNNLRGPAVCSRIQPCSHEGKRIVFHAKLRLLQGRQHEQGGLPRCCYVNDSGFARCARRQSDSGRAQLRLLEGWQRKQGSLPRFCDIDCGRRSTREASD